MHIAALIKKIHITEEPKILAEQCKSKFKDLFTKAVEVFVSQIFKDDPAVTDDAFILSTSIGNSENIVKLINEYRHAKFVSAQLFPEATMSSASVNINRLFGLKGGNMSVNSNLALNDAVFLSLLDTACNRRTTHLIYGEVNDFDSHPKIPNHLIYIKITFSDKGSYVHLAGSEQGTYPHEYEVLSEKLKTMMSPALYQFIANANTRGEVANVCLNRELVHA